jgi:hypothetical protein
MKLWTGACLVALYLLARLEVSNALRMKRIADEQDCEDLLPSRLVPSVARAGCRDRVLAEIDQDGFVFACDACDMGLFNTRDIMIPRKHHRVQIVLAGESVRLRKSNIRGGGSFARVSKYLQLDFYLEAAALLRLHKLAFVPTVRRIDPGQGIIEMDYIWGQDLRQVFAGGASEIQYDRVFEIFRDLGARHGEISRQIAELLSEAIACGVIPRDVHPANFVQARRSRKLYMVDFNFSHLRPIPGWRFHRRSLERAVGQPLRRRGRFY